MPLPPPSLRPAVQSASRLQIAPTGPYKVTGFLSDPDWLAASAQLIAVWMIQQEKQSQLSRPLRLLHLTSGPLLRVQAHSPESKVE